MIVVDASLVLELMIVTPGAPGLNDCLNRSGEELIAPEVMDIEVLQALRRQVRLKHVSAERARLAIGILQSLPISSESHQQLLPRIWQLRGNLTAFDAACIALAEIMKAPLWTRDANYLGASGHTAAVEIL